jgi:hypothetical protein
MHSALTKFSFIGLYFLTSPESVCRNLGLILFLKLTTDLDVEAQCGLLEVDLYIDSAPAMKF